MTTSLTTCTIIFTSSLKLFCCGPSHTPTSQSISLISLGSQNISPRKGPFKGHLIICRELRGPGEQMRFAFLLVNSSFQTNPTGSKLDENKTEPQTCLPSSPHTVGIHRTALGRPREVHVLQARCGTLSKSQRGRNGAAYARRQSSALTCNRSRPKSEPQPLVPANTGKGS